MSNSNLSLSTKVTGRRVSKIFKAPLVEKVREEDGSTTFQCTGPYSSMEDSDSSVGSAYRGRRGNKYGKIDDGLIFFVFILLGGCVSIVLGLVSLLSIVLGEWVLLETAELLGSLALLSSGYLASVILYGSWYNCFGKSIVLDSHCVVNLVAAYIAGAAVCNLVGFVLPSTTFDLTHLLLLAGWLAVSNSCSQTAMSRRDFLRSEENYLLVACTLVQRTLVRSLFRAFLPPVLLPMIDHSCHLVGLTFTTALHQWVGGVSLTTRGRSATPNYNRRSSSLGNIHQSFVYPYGRKSALSLGKSSRSTQSSISGLHRASSAETSHLLEARGLLNDLILNSSFTPVTKEKLSHISSLLGPSSLTNIPIMARVRSADVLENPNHSSQSSTMFAVATTSTGMPVMPDVPQDRQRAPTRNEFPRTKIYEEKPHTPTDHRPSFPIIQRHQTSLLRVPESPLAKSISISEVKKSHPDDSSDGGNPGTSVVHSPPEPSDSGTTPNLNDQEPSSQFSPKSSLDSVTEQMRKISVSSVNDMRTSSISGSHGKYSVFNRFQEPDPEYDIHYYSECQNEVISELGTWDFPIFRFYEDTNGHALSLIAYQVFMEMGLMETFHLPSRPFIDFFRTLELNYGCGPYHNSRHAADVLHATFYLLTEAIPEFTHAYTGEESSRVRAEASKPSLISGSMSSAFSILELFAGLLAAACHDYDHPGRTNAFLTATKNPLAILYNDRSVLENHHAATSWELLTSDTKRNFVMDLDPAEYKRLRFLFIEGILATDLKMHFGMIGDFKAKFVLAGNIDWSSQEDRLMVMKMIIKMADINGPSKSTELHKLWTECITEEFYQQDEEEKQLGLPLTMFLQRDQPDKLPKVQLSFVQNLVSPLFQVCAQAHIIPGELVPLEVVGAPQDVSNERKWSSDAVPLEVPKETMDDSSEGDDFSPERKFTSVILDNLRANVEMWQGEIDKIEGSVAVEGDKMAPPPQITVEDSVEGDIEDN